MRHRVLSTLRDYSGCRRRHGHGTRAPGDQLQRPVGGEHAAILNPSSVRRTQETGSISRRPQHSQRAGLAKRFPMNTRKFMGIFAIAFAFALAGCQSGGGSTNPTPTTAQSGSGSDGSSTTAAPPASQSGSGGTTVPPANQGGDGTTTSPPPAAAYTVSGTVSGSVIAGVTITATPGGVAAVTDDSGNYVLKNLPAGSYAVTPSYSGVTFTPASKTVTVSNGAVTGVNFSDPLQVLKEDTLLYPCPNAVCQKDLITGDEAVAVTPLATYGQEQPVNVVPFRSGDRIAFVGYKYEWDLGVFPNPRVDPNICDRREYEFNRRLLFGGGSEFFRCRSYRD